MPLKYMLLTSLEKSLTVIIEFITASQDFNYTVTVYGMSPLMGTRRGGEQNLRIVGIATLE